MYVCIGKSIIYIEFSTIHGFKATAGGVGTYPSWKRRGLLCLKRTMLFINVEKSTLLLTSHSLGNRAMSLWHLGTSAK